MTAQSPPYALQAGSHPAELFRRAISTLIGSGGGVVGANDLLVTQNGVANMSVNVAGGLPGGEVWIDGTTSAAQGYYYAYNDATLNLAVAASNPTNPRIDIAVAQVQDAAYTGAVNSFQLAIVTGTPAGSPVAPATPVSSLKLANIAVAALATTVVTANITDTRSRISLAPPASQFTSTLNTFLGLSDTAVRRGKSIIATEETRNSTSFGLMATPDRVSGITLPTDGLIFVAYQALWKTSGQGQAAIFLNSNQVKIRPAYGAGATAPIAGLATTEAEANEYEGLASGGSGLIGSPSAGAGDPQTSDVATGQVVGILGGVFPPGGPACIFAAAGTYDVSVQFKASAGTVTAKERKLWVWTLGF